MKKTLFLALIALASISITGRALASSIIALPLPEHVSSSAAVFRGTVLSQTPFIDPADNIIYTRSVVRVDEGLLGTFPAAVKVVHRGGKIAGRSEFFGLSPRLVVGESYLLFVVRGTDGQLNYTQGSASAVHLDKSPARQTGFIAEQEALLTQVRALIQNNQLTGDNVTDQAGNASTKAVPGLLVDGAGIASRFLPQDRGEPIGYLVDADNLPAGITLTVASNAVRQALNAWTAVTSVRFRFEGYQSFGVGADTISVDDSRLRIQLHDNYNRINSASVLGIGGNKGAFLTLSPGWDLGGKVGTNEFQKSTCGFVVLERTSPTLQNAQTLAEVLCHEIGHALSMAHSSEVTSSNPLLTNSIMYFQAHADGRGATLGTYDPPVIQQAYPTNNTPPYTFGRMMYMTTGNPTPNVPGINEVELRGYDLQTTNLTVQTTDASANNGTFSLTGNLLKFAIPSGNYSDSPVFDPTTGDSWDSVYFRVSDGTNASPFGEARILSFSHDSIATSDGIPNNWMIANFGNANPNTGLNHKASDDADGDGMKNLIEYRTGMNPNSAASAQRVSLISPTNIQFQARAYELYELHGSTNLTNWARVAIPVVPTNSTGIFTGFTNTTPIRYFRVQKVP